MSQMPQCHKSDKSLDELNETNPNPFKKLSRSNSATRKQQVHLWLRVQEIHHQIRNCEDGSEKTELYLNYGDRLCDVDQFTEALVAYGQALVELKPNQHLSHESLIYFIQAVTKVIGVYHQETTAKAGNLCLETIDDKPEGGWTYYMAQSGDPCTDPWSCGNCSGVLVEPVTLPCGHTFCRTHVMPCGGTNVSQCIKCKSPWRIDEPRLALSTSGQMKRQQYSPFDDLDMISTNVGVKALVNKYWAPELKSVDLRTKAKRHYNSNQFGVALALYNDAFKLAPDDHLILSNRSITHFKGGDFRASLSDAEAALQLKPDFPKAHLRRGMALRHLGNHMEAFMAFYVCLALEDGTANPVKQELTKELYHLLTNAANNISTGPDDHSLGTTSQSPIHMSHMSLINNSSFCDISVFKETDLPKSLRQLSKYLDNIATNGEPGPNTFNASAEDNQWLIQNTRTIQMTYRTIDANFADSGDFECPLCIRLLWQPITTPCGHTFCKMCLDRVLDHNTACPMCKSATLKIYLADRKETMVNEFIECSMKRMVPGHYLERRKIHENEMEALLGQTGVLEGVPTAQTIPVFVCTMSFPNILCPLHVFEPRYRLMIRRCMEIGTRAFGMCCKIDDNKP